MGAIGACMWLEIFTFSESNIFPRPFMEASQSHSAR